MLPTTCPPGQILHSSEALIIIVVILNDRSRRFTLSLLLLAAPSQSHIVQQSHVQAAISLGGDPKGTNLDNGVIIEKVVFVFLVNLTR